MQWANNFLVDPPIQKVAERRLGLLKKCKPSAEHKV